MKDPQTDVEELKYWLALARMPGLGAAGVRRLLENGCTPHRLFEVGGDRVELAPAAEAWRQRPDWAAVEADLAWLDAGTDRHVLTLSDPRYPPLLKEIADPPPVLFLRGDPARLAEHQLAIVGSRNPSPGGERDAADFARRLAECGLIITSGLAVGIDAAAHRGALASGATIAVTGSGLDRVYPPRHGKLAEEIAARGALVSEFPPGTPPRPENFPRRNRLISGLALGTLVVEAALRSGSLITARLAAEQGREVFAIPGSIHHPLSRGCHALLRQGAKLVETAADILEELGPLAAWGMPPPARNASPSTDGAAEFGELLKHIGFEPTAVDTVVERSGLTAEQVSSMLVVLELQGHVTSAPGGLYTRIPT